jgi:hypothetical protein
MASLLVLPCARQPLQEQIASAFLQNDTGVVGGGPESVAVAILQMRVALSRPRSPSPYAVKWDQFSALPPCSARRTSPAALILPFCSQGFARETVIWHRDSSYELEDYRLEAVPCWGYGRHLWRDGTLAPEGSLYGWSRSGGSMDLLTASHDARYPCQSLTDPLLFRNYPLFSTIRSTPKI